MHCRVHAYIPLFFSQKFFISAAPGRPEANRIIEMNANDLMTTFLRVSKKGTRVLFFSICFLCRVLATVQLNLICIICGQY